VRHVKTPLSKSHLENESYAHLQLSLDQIASSESESRKIKTELLSKDELSMSEKKQKDFNIYILVFVLGSKLN